MKHQELRLRGIKLNELEAMQSYLTEPAKKNPNVDLSRSYMNHAIENLSTEQLESRVADRIAQLDLKKRPRFDSIGIEDKARYGKENVMYCQCHMDESEPHIHVGIVPITSEGQLSATKLFTYQETKLLATADYEKILQIAIECLCAKGQGEKDEAKEDG